MKIKLYSGDDVIVYDECEVESSFAELTFTGQQWAGYTKSGATRYERKRIVTTLGYIIETEVDKPPVEHCNVWGCADPATHNSMHHPIKHGRETTFGSLLPNRSTDHLPEGSI